MSHSAVHTPVLLLLRAFSRNFNLTFRKLPISAKKHSTHWKPDSFWLLKHKGFQFPNIFKFQCKLKLTLALGTFFYLVSSTLSLTWLTRPMKSLITKTPLFLPSFWMQLIIGCFFLIQKTSSSSSKEESNHPLYLQCNIQCLFCMFALFFFYFRASRPIDFLITGVLSGFANNLFSIFPYFNPLFHQKKRKIIIIIATIMIIIK